MVETGDLVELEVKYTGIYIFLSYLVSFIGSWTTIEMLLKRTGSSGWWNIMLLLGAGIAFGSTATFGMHFIGNQSVTLQFAPPWEGTGVPLSYNAGFTILSLVVSCISMVLAFSFIGLRIRLPVSRARIEDEEDGAAEADAPYDLDTKGEPYAASPDTTETAQGMQALGAMSGSKKSARKEKRRAEVEDEDEEGSQDEFGVGAAKVSAWGVVKILIAGIVCGGGIAAMHYIGQVSIDSVTRVTNDWYTVFLSVLIAMVCVSIGLYILFVVFRPRLQHSWLKRILVAAILAVGVTLMHFVALLGTHYWVRAGDPLETGSDSTTKIVIIAIICCVAPICCICLLVFAYVGQQRALRQRAARHRVILSTAIFDHHGLMLVDPESGLLPFARIYPTPLAEDHEDKIHWRQLFRFQDRLRLDAAKLKLQRSDPVFVAFLRLSWKWRLPRADSGEDTATPTYRGSIAFSDFARRSPLKASSSQDLSDPEAGALVRSIASFQLAGEEIAEAVTGVNDPKALGVLYDNILKIGHYEVSSKSSNDKFVVSQGQMLLLARRLRTVAEREALLARGFVFAEPAAVARMTSNAYAVPYDRVFDHFRSAYSFARYGVTRRIERGRLYGGLLMLQALPGEGLQVLVDEKQHHSLPMIELATIVDSQADPSKVPSTRGSTITLDETVEAVDEIALNTLYDLVATPSSSLRHAAQLRNLLVDVLRPQLERFLTADVLDFVINRLEVAPTLIPLTARHGPSYGPDGLGKESYCVCLKTIIPSSVKLPSSKLAWLPFPLFQAQNDCVTRASGGAAGSARAGAGVSSAEGRPSTTLWSTSSKSDPSGEQRSNSGGDASSEGGLALPIATTSPFVSTAFPSAPRAPRSSGSAAASPSGLPRRLVTTPVRDGSQTSESFDPLDDEADSHEARPTSSAGPSQQPHTGIPEYSPDWVVELVRITAAKPGQNRWEYDPQPSSRRR
ncbi:hypothetical protein JCM10908_000176 [Rhodotorula pacifica]|uniref:uncharacterized protein n=1 Tax=Rhodotorula pacifica TaxID=1495444 RepID=UPI00317165BA